MALSTGVRVGPYEILAPLGKGGMAEVYKARDTKLERVVALKTLPALFAADPDGWRASRARRAAMRASWTCGPATLPAVRQAGSASQYDSFSASRTTVGDSSQAVT